MLKKALRQYLELVKLSGIEEIFLDSPAEKETYHIKKKASISESGKDNSLESISEISRLAINYSQCKKCPLANERTNFVYGEGNPHAKLMLIGEGPGEEEDKTGRPFVGKAGQLLDRMLAAINIKREEVYIANTVKCRPPNNRNPLESEVTACLPYLNEQIDLIKPSLILLLGKVAATNLLNKSLTMTDFRASVYEYKGVKTYVTYHPAALLRNPDWKKLAWIDLQKIQIDYKSLRKD